jgi:hypothetical protein
VIAVIASPGAMPHRRPILLLALCAVALLIPIGSARADTEPANNTLLGAEGPLKQGVKYSGKQPVANDPADWYYLYIQPQVELTVTHSSKCVTPSLSLTGRNGEAWADDEGVLISNSSEPITYTTPPGPARLYYLRAWCETEGTYSFTVTAKTPDAIMPGPNQFGPPVGFGEPNEFITQAIGPLVGGITYQGVTGTSNDADWFYFYAKPQRELEISTTALNCGSGDVYFYTEESDTNWNQLTRVATNEVNRLTYTTDTSLRKYHLKAGCEGGDYVFKIEPASAIATQACVDAIAARDAVAAWSRSEQQKLRRARRKHVVLMRKLKRRIKQKRRARAAKQTMRKAKRRHRKRIKKLKTGSSVAKRALADHQGATQAACA